MRYASTTLTSTKYTLCAPSQRAVGSLSALTPAVLILRGIFVQVDNHIHAASASTASELLAFMQSKVCLRYAPLRRHFLLLPSIRRLLFGAQRSTKLLKHCGREHCWATW